MAIRHAEVLEDGELGVRPLKTAKATDAYVLAGPDEVTLEPVFTFHGFRYAEVTGVDGLAADDIEAVVVGTDLRRTGWFASSHPLLDRFHDNVVWSARGNFLDVPTDCPQRDERLGWTGDIQVFAPTATFLFDAAGFLTNWLADLAAEQYADGSVPFVIPDVLRTERPAAAAWGDAATVVPWVIYQRTGDVGVLRTAAAQHARLGRPDRRAGRQGLPVDRRLPVRRLARPDRAAGGTVPPRRPTPTSSRPRTWPGPPRSSRTAAAVLGDRDTAAHYADLAARTREAFAREYVTGRRTGDQRRADRLRAGAGVGAAARRAGAGRCRAAPGGPGAHLRLPDQHRLRRHTADRRRADLGRRRRRGATACCCRPACPSWLYPVTMGATTVWERWDSMLPDGRINPGEMTSFNHYALGAVADWLHRTVAGLAPAAPGYRRITVRPQPGPVLADAAARHLTPYGEAAVEWRRSGRPVHAVGAGAGGQHGDRAPAGRQRSGRGRARQPRVRLRRPVPA